MIRVSRFLALGLLAGLALHATPAGGQSLEQKIESLSLATRARLVLAGDEVLRPYPITVDADGNVLILQGRVDTGDHSARATTLVGRIPGVRGVRNELQVADGSEPETYDLIPVDELELEDLESIDPMMVLEWETPASESEAAVPAPGLSGPAATDSPVIYKVPEGYHLVEPGETLLRISGKYGLTIRELRELNSLSITDRPEPGQLLRIRPLDGGGR